MFVVNFRPARLRDDGPPTISVASPARKHVAQLGIFEVTLEAMRMRLLSLRGTMCFVRGQTASRSRLGSVVHVVIAALLQQWLLPVSRELDGPSDPGLNHNFETFRPICLWPIFFSSLLMAFFGISDGSGS